MKRYTMYMRDGYGQAGATIETSQDSTGNWVRAEDALALLAENERLKAELAQIRHEERIWQWSEHPDIQQKLREEQNEH